MPLHDVLPIVEALGSGFAEDLRVGEDVDLVWRLVAAENRVRYEPAVTAGHDVRGRSEEHTSELQSLMRTSYAVFCLKKNTKKFSMIDTKLKTHTYNQHQFILIELIHTS